MNQIKALIKEENLKMESMAVTEKRAYIDKVMTRVKESEKRCLMLEEAAYEKAMSEQLEREQREFELQCENYNFERGDVKY